MVDLAFIKKVAFEWFTYCDRCEIVMEASNIGYASQTPEGRLQEDGGAGGGMPGKTKVPDTALDSLRRDPYLQHTDRIMRIMPREYRDALEEEYRSRKKANSSEYNRHRRSLKEVVIWWRGYEARDTRAVSERGEKNHK